MAIYPYQQHTPSIDHTAYIAPSADIIGQVTIGQDSSVWPMATLRGDMHTISIGKKTNLQDGVVCHITHDSQYNPGGHSLVVGNNVTVGHRATLHGCHIQDNCIIGINAVILDGVRIEKNTIIAAGSLVSPNKTIKSGFLYMGQPAKPVRELTEQELEFIQYSADNYVKLKNNYMLSSC